MLVQWGRTADASRQRIVEANGNTHITTVNRARIVIVAVHRTYGRRRRGRYIDALARVIAGALAGRLALFTRIDDTIATEHDACVDIDFAAWCARYAAPCELKIGAGIAIGIERRSITRLA
jgi:hypothetical protein